MALSEICYLILHEGLGTTLKKLSNPKEIMGKFLIRILGKKNARYVTDSSITADDHDRQEKIQAFPDEHAAEKGYDYFRECCLSPTARTAILRRAERRVAKNVLAYERERIDKKTSMRGDSIHGDAQPAKVQEACKAALNAAEKILAYYELREGERKALDASSQVFYEVISSAYALNDVLITETAQSALEAGLEALGDEDDEDKSGIRNAVATKLEKTLNETADVLKKHIADKSFLSMPKEELRTHLRLTVSCGEGSRNILNEITTAARKGAESALGKDNVNLNPALREALEKWLGELETRIKKTVGDQKRVGEHCLNFLKAETTKIIKKALRQNVTVQSEKDWEKIERQIRIHLRDLKKNKVIVARRRKGFKENFYGLKKWETDEARWLHSGANVDITELAEKLPELSGKAETSGSAPYAGFDALFCAALIVLGRWLTTSHFFGIIKCKTGQIIEVRDDDDVPNQSVEDSPDAASLQFDKDLERINMIDRLPVNKDLREFWNAVRQNWNHYDVAVKTLKEAGWSDSKISRNKKEFLILLKEAGLSDD
jgi:hypothetical protein